MKPKTIFKIKSILMAAFVMLNFADSVLANDQRKVISKVNKKAHYAIVNGLKMYYITAGQGQPLVLLHGALSTIDKDFGELIPQLAKDHLVIGIEMQAHGHTSDNDRPLSYEVMAGDVITLLKQLKITNADFFGYSMGGGVSLQVAITHPKLVRHLILAATSYSPEGSNMANPGSLKSRKLDDLDHSIWKKNYLKVAPDKSHWSKLVQKNYGLMGSWKGFKANDIKYLKVPTLLIFGDGDLSTPEHQIAMFRLLGGGNWRDIYETPTCSLQFYPEQVISIW
jgi:pimeloyl-ACP methyl ester carboxylesterase